MRLHIAEEDKSSFKTLIERIYEKTGHRRDVLEKDYYVVLMLKELADMQNNNLPAYFKGGTALYKALKTTNRFSEDIDISVEARDCSRSQKDKRLDKATKSYKCLKRKEDEGFSHKSEIATVYEYEPIVVYDKSDELQRFGKVKVEATSFTISEPTETLEIAPMLYEYADKDFQKTLREQFDVAPFNIQIMSFERIFVDKLFAAESYVRKSDEDNRAFEAAKHIYDLAVIYNHPRILTLYHNQDLLASLLRIRLEEEKERLDGIPGISPSEFTFFEDAKTDGRVIDAYADMQRQYVLRDQDRISYEEAISRLQFIKNKLGSNSSWTVS